MDSDVNDVFNFPEWCRRTALVLEAERTSVEKMTGIVHNEAYANHQPTEGWHRHCCFPVLAGPKPVLRRTLQALSTRVERAWEGLAAAAMSRLWGRP